MRKKYSEIPVSELNDLVRELHSKHPRAGAEVITLYIETIIIILL